MKKLKILVISTPVGPLYSSQEGTSGGVSFTLSNLCENFLHRGHQLKIIAPEKSLSNLPLRQVSGKLAPSIQLFPRDYIPSISADYVLWNMWKEADALQKDYDVVLNFSYDWVSYYLSSFFSIPVKHFLSLSSTNNAIDQMLQHIYEVRPESLAMMTQAQAQTYPFSFTGSVVGDGIEVEKYYFSPQAQNFLMFMGRISPEKGLEDVLEVARRSKMKIKMAGFIQDQTYWKKLQQKYQDVDQEYLGFLNFDQIQQVLPYASALLVTPKWEEAFGRVAIEAMACGVPVLGYSRGGLKEIVRQGETGFLVEPDNVDALLAMLEKTMGISRQYCRQYVEQNFSLEKFSDRMEKWLTECQALTQGKI